MRCLRRYSVAGDLLAAVGHTTKSSSECFFVNHCPTSSYTPVPGAPAAWGATPLRYRRPAASAQTTTGRAGGGFAGLDALGEVLFQRDSVPFDRSDLCS